jgi:putative flippase GtrA
MSLIARFLVTGAVGTLFSYSVYAVLVFFGLNYAVANFASLVAGILFSFRAQGRFVFRNTDRSLFTRFVLCWLAIYAANVWFIGKAMALGFNKYAAGAVAIPAIAALSFVVQRYLVFGASGLKPGPGAQSDRPRPAA